MPQRYFVRDDQGRMSGPHGPNALRRMASEGKLLPSWYISADGKKWILAGQVQKLFPHLDKALADQLPTGHHSKSRDLTRKEKLAWLIDEFVLKNEQLRDTLPFLRPVRVWWARLTLPSNFVTAQATPAGVRYVRHDLGTGDATDIDQKKADRNVADGVRQFDWFKWIATVLGVIWAVWSFKDFTFDFSLLPGIAKTLLFAGLAIGGFILKLKRTRVFVGYVMDPAVTQRLEAIKQAFQALRRCSHVWIYQVRQHQDDKQWKYNAGSLFTVARLPAALFNRPIPNVETNVTVCGIAHGSQAVYFLPDKLLVIERGEVRHFDYGDLVVTADQLDYVEPEGHVYKDSQVIDQRWKYINRDGSQDRRFKDNVELPVVRCGIVRLRVGDTRMELMTTNPKAPESFRAGIP